MRFAAVRNRLPLRRNERRPEKFDTADLRQALSDSCARGLRGYADFAGVFFRNTRLPDVATSDSNGMPDGGGV